ncbi:MAG: pyridoxal phosphate-dependent aminotransferase [Candidatus Omnitrophica bacterium]|nr:pyridoxal phosphate-dependent aminotransferase [Candidatus Omnitrophota bacterium]
MKHLFNPAVEEIPQAMSIRFNQMVYERKRAGQDVIVLSLGEAFFDIPMFDFKALDFVKGYHYSESQGIPELRERIANFYHRQYGVPVNSKSEILISAGSKPLIFMSMLCVLQPGEEVVVHEPCWLSYPEQARLCGARTRFIPYDVDIQDFLKFITPRTRMVVLNNPNNPAGRIYPAEGIRQLTELCADRGIYLMVDEAYSDFVLDDAFQSVGKFSPGKEFIIIINSLSKNMGISGWRIGYTIGHPEFIQALLKVNQHVITCASTILLMYCAKYFDEILSYTLPQARAVVEKRARVAEMMKGVGLECLSGGSTFYFFVSLGDYPGTSFDFATDLLGRYGISVVPGFAYGKSTDRFIRVSIGTESEERILYALKKIKGMIVETKASGAVFTTEQNQEADDSSGPDERQGQAEIETTLKETTAGKKQKSKRTEKVRAPLP